MSVVEPQGDFQSRRDFFFLNGWPVNQCDLRFCSQIFCRTIEKLGRTLEPCLYQHYTSINQPGPALYQHQPALYQHQPAWTSIIPASTSLDQHYISINQPGPALYQHQPAWTSTISALTSLDQHYTSTIPASTSLDQHYISINQPGPALYQHQPAWTSTISASTSLDQHFTSINQPGPALYQHQPAWTSTLPASTSLDQHYTSINQPGPALYSINQPGPALYQCFFKMAPLFMAGRLLSVLFVLCLSYFLTHTVRALLVYDHQMLLNIRSSVEVLSSTVLRGSNFNCSPPITSIPACLRRSPWVFTTRKRRRRRGKRGGIAVKLRLYLADLPAHCLWVDGPGSGLRQCRFAVVPGACSLVSGPGCFAWLGSMLVVFSFTTRRSQSWKSSSSESCNTAGWWVNTGQDGPGKRSISG